MNILSKLEYIDPEAMTLKLKGRIAAGVYNSYNISLLFIYFFEQINTCNAVLLTEMIFQNLFKDLDPAEIVSILSSLVLERDNDDESIMNGKLEETLSKVEIILENLCKLEQKCGIKEVETSFGEILHPSLMQVVYEWAKGVPFYKICTGTSFPEGQIVNAILRTAECCKELVTSARLIGDIELAKRAELASDSVKRDIVFVASLYIS